MRDLALGHSFGARFQIRSSDRIARTMTTPGLPQRPSYGSSLRPIEENDLAGYGSDFGFDGEDLDSEYGDYDLEFGDRMRVWAGRILVRVGWLALAAGLAFGSAGVVAASEHLPSTGARPELTWAADQALNTRLDAAIRELALLKQDIDSLGTQARATLSSLTQVNQVTLRAAWDAGWNNVNSIDAEAADLKSKLDCPGLAATSASDLAKQYSPPIVVRYQLACAAVASVAPVHDDWQSMVDSSKTAFQVVDDIESHDSIATDALKLATQGRYPEALLKLAQASSALSGARVIAGNMAKVTDVSTLTAWLNGTANWDGAAKLLWQTTIDSKGVVTKEVTAALRGEAEARAQLPSNNSVLQVVMYEIAGNMTSDGISIEAARGQLGSALDQLTGGSVLGG
jgi:hypothetical protein